MTDTTSETSGLFGTGEFFLRDNYAPVTDELTQFDLPVEGAVPAELDGWYLRNGPNPRQAPKHWFSGDGMVVLRGGAKLRVSRGYRQEFEARRGRTPRR